MSRNHRNAGIPGSGRSEVDQASVSAPDGLPLSVVLVDPDTVRYVEVDQSLCGRLHYSPDELVQVSVAQSHPDLGPEVLRELYRQLNARGSNVKFYTRQRRSSGELMDAFVTATLTT